MLELLSVETKKDYSDLIKQVDVDIMCDTAVDSLNMVDIAIDLEDRLGIKIEDQNACVLLEKLLSYGTPDSLGCPGDYHCFPGKFAAAHVSCLLPSKYRLHYG